MAKPTTPRKKSRSAARQPAADPRQLEVFAEDPILFLGEEPAAKQSFHVKQDMSPRGREAQAVARRMSDNNQAVAKILLDTVVTLCEDGTLDPAEWAKELALLAELADGTE